MIVSQVVNAYLAKINHVQSQSLTALWYLDSSASNHISCDATVLSSLKLTIKTHVTSTSGHNHNVMSVGNVAICLPSNEIQ